jgi:mRNA interferase RelE/StbE
VSGKYAVRVAPAALRALRKTDLRDRRRVQAVIELLADDPRPPACKAMAGQPVGTYRVRTGDYRIVYEIHDDRLVVLVVERARARVRATGSRLDVAAILADRDADRR